LLIMASTVTNRATGLAAGKAVPMVKRKVVTASIVGAAADVCLRARPAAFAQGYRHWIMQEAQESQPPGAAWREEEDRAGSAALLWARAARESEAPTGSETPTPASKR
jgi:hypothetical protein